jgi:hypothetical protein
VLLADDEPAAIKVWLPELARILGAKPPHHFPTWLARIFAGEALVMMATEARGASNAKAKRELGWSPGPRQLAAGVRGDVRGDGEPGALRPQASNSPLGVPSTSSGPTAARCPSRRHPPQGVEESQRGALDLA